MIRILVADDHPVVRHGLRQMFDATPDLRVAAEATTSDEAIHVVKQEKWDVVLLDLGLPGAGGIEVLRTIKAHAPKMPVLVLSVHPEGELAVRLLRLGADGYVTKGADSDVLISAIRKVARGGRFVSEAVNEKLLEGVGRRSAEAEPHERLSDREYQVLRLLAAGKTTTEIANDLSLSVKTVSTYRARILEKMDLRTSAELMRYVIAHQLVPLPPP
jgi:two-component system, NarL family, invasion response regulator UvrY